MSPSSFLSPIPGVKNADLSELQEIASEPDSTHVYNVAEFDLMHTVVESLTRMVCSGLEAQDREIRGTGDGRGAVGKSTSTESVLGQNVLFACGCLAGCPFLPLLPPSLLIFFLLETGSCSVFSVALYSPPSCLSLWRWDHRHTASFSAPLSAQDWSQESRREAY